MSKLLSRVVSPAALLYIFVVLTQVGYGVYSAGQLEPPPSFDLISRFGFLWIVGWWLLKDRRTRGIKLVFDMGLFLYIAWPFFMPYYLVRTRGAKGMLVIMGFVGAWVGALVVGVALYLLVFPQSAWPAYLRYR